MLATDTSPQMMAWAEEALAPIPAETRCEVRDGQSLGLEAASNDATFSRFGIFLFPERLVAWKAAAEVLRLGGLFVTSVWRGPEFNKLASGQMAPLMAALPSRLTPSGSLMTR